MSVRSAGDDVDDPAAAATGGAAGSVVDAAERDVLERFLQKRRRAQQARLEKGETYRLYLRWSGKALEIPVAVVVGLLIGKWIDGRFPTAPWGTLAGLCFGVAAAVRFIVRLVRLALAEAAAEDQQGGGRA